jgi:hypothetical protein
VGKCDDEDVTLDLSDIGKVLYQEEIVDIGTLATYYMLSFIDSKE